MLENATYLCYREYYRSTIQIRILRTFSVIAKTLGLNLQ